MDKRSDMDHGLLLLIVAVLAWIIPGAGHFFIKEKKRAAIIFVTITATFVTGLFVGSIAVVDPSSPTLWYAGQMLASPTVVIAGQTTQHKTALWRNKKIEAQKAVQVAMQYKRESDKAIKGLLENGSPEAMKKTQLITKKADKFKQDADKLTQEAIAAEFVSYGRPHDVGQIYTAIAGGLNLLAILSAVYMAHSGRGEMIGKDEDE